MEMKIVNHIKIDGQEYLFEELSAERKKDIACLIQENAMKAAGYCKVTRKEAAGGDTSAISAETRSMWIRATKESAIPARRRSGSKQKNRKTTMRGGERHGEMLLLRDRSAER